MKRVFLFLSFFLGFFLLYKPDLVLAGHCGDFFYNRGYPQSCCADGVREWVDEFVDENNNPVCWDVSCNQPDSSCSTAPQPTPTPIPPPSRDIEIWAKITEIHPLLSGPDWTRADLYARSTGTHWFTVSGTWGVDFRTGPDPGIADYFVSPSPQTNKSVWVTDGWTYIGTFSTQVANNTGQCLTNISGRVSVRPFFSGDATVTNSISNTNDQVINIGAMISRVIVNKSNGQPAQGAAVIISPFDNNPGGAGPFSSDQFGQVFGIYRLNCSSSHTITASLPGYNTASLSLPAQSGNTGGTICNGQSREFTLTLSPIGQPTPTPTPIPPPSGCGTPPGGASWRWKDASVGYACTTNLASCNPADACVGTPYQCQGTNWVQLNAGECTTACFGFCSGGPAPTPTPTPVQPPSCTPVNVSASPNPVSPNSPITITATSSYGYTSTGMNTGGGTGGETQGSYCCSPNFTWRWFYNTISTPGTYTATFTGRKGGDTCRGFGNFTIAAAPTPTPTPTPTPVLSSISGVIFIDNNGDGTKQPSENCYSGAVDLFLGGSAARSQTFNSASTCNQYSFTNLSSGTYNVSMNPPAGYTPTSPVNIAGIVLPPNRIDANFGLTNAAPWWQTKLGDVRAGGGSLTDRVPSSCVGACTPLLSLTSGSAGMVSYKTPPTADFGSGSASSPNWKVDSQFGGSAYSYDYITARVSQSGTATAGFDGNNPPTTSGVYTAAGDATIASAGGNWQVPAGAKITVLVGGNLTINRVIKVAQGGFLAIYVKGDINVSPSLGTTHNNDSDNQLEGLYVANGSFQTGQTQVCNPGNNRLNVGGTIVVDADLNGSGNLSQQRCLGPRDSLYPSFYVNYRPDFLLNAPTYVQRSGLVWQEIAP